MKHKKAIFASALLQLGYLLFWFAYSVLFQPNYPYSRSIFAVYAVLNMPAFVITEYFKRSLESVALAFSMGLLVDMLIYYLVFFLIFNRKEIILKFKTIIANK